MPRNVGDRHDDFDRRFAQWARVRAALEGRDAIKDSGERYLPRPTAMSDDQYTAYKERAAFYPVIERTLRGMSGMVFRNSVKVELPQRLEPLIECATPEGNSLDVLTENIINEVGSIGRFGMLLDFPQETADSTAIPYISTYVAEDIEDWQMALRAGKRQLVRVVLTEDFDEDEHIGGDAIEEMRLELLLNDEGHYEVRKWIASSVGKRDKDGKKQLNSFVLYGEPVVPTIKGKPLDYIPFVFVNPYDLRPNVEKPPMLDLVDVNLDHYKNSADYEHALYLTAQPTPWVAGNLDEAKKPTSIGSGTIWYLPQDATAGMLEFQGAGVSAQRDAMKDKEDRMASLGARMIYEGKSRNEASDTARMRGKGEMSLLTNVVNMAEAGLKQLLRTAAEWIGGNPDDVVVKFNRDWVETRLDPNELNALVKAWQSGGISHLTFWENLQSGEVAPNDRTHDEEQDLIDEEGEGVGAINAALATPPVVAPPVEDDDKREDDA